MGHVTPAPGTNQRRGRPGGHGGTHPVRLLEMLLCPIVGLWGALAAPLRAPLQRGRWPRSVCTPHSSCVAGGDRQVPESSGSSRCRGPRGDPREVAPPPPPPPAGRRLNNSKPPSPRRDEPRPWLQSPPAAQPVSPAQGAGAATRTRGPGPVSLHEAPAACACPVREPPVHLSPHLSLRPSPCPSPHLSPLHLSRSICPRCVPASVGRRVCPRVRSRSHLAAQAEHLPGSAPAP